MVRHYLTLNITEKISEELRDVLIDLNKKIAEAWNLEVHNEFEKSSKIWRKLISGDFPICNEKLVNESFFDKKSPYFTNND